MRKITFFVAALASAAVALAGGPASTAVQRKAPAKAPATKVAASKAPAKSSIIKPVSLRSAPTKSSVTTARKPVTATASAQRSSSKKPRVTPVTWRNRQTSPSADRFKQIQDALASKGYLTSEEATGEWNAASAAALKRFQAEQTLDPSGKINSISLIALGLGPKHDLTANRALDGNYPEPESGHNDR